jgi:DNA-binding response OmpR family regulator
LARIIAANNIVLNEDLHLVTVCNQPINLSPTEYLLLRYLMNMADRPVSKMELFQNVWGYSELADVNLVRVGVHRLREKIEENPAQPTHVLTVPGFGYKFQTAQQLYHS